MSRHNTECKLYKNLICRSVNLPVK